MIMPQLVSGARSLDGSPEALGELREANPLLSNPAELNERMRTDGYLLLRGLLDREEVLAARQTAVEILRSRGHLEPGTDPMDCIWRRASGSPTQHDIAKENAPLKKVLYSGAMIGFFEHLLGEAVRHFDYTWFRAIAPGLGTPPHCDVVYMGRAERERLFTAWTPIGDLDYAQGGLMILEGSNNLTHLRETYGNSDVDSFCENRTGLAARDHWGPGRSNGWLGRDPVKLRSALGGGRWLTTEFRAGDVLIFTVFTVHASLDNQSNRIRLSSDSRYQPASKPADERWIGANPIGHGSAGKRGKIC
jgi:hypothetical protein